MLEVVLGGGVLRESRGWYETKHDDGCTVVCTLPVLRGCGVVLSCCDPHTPGRGAAR